MSRRSRRLQGMGPMGPQASPTTLPKSLPEASLKASAKEHPKEHLEVPKAPYDTLTHAEIRDGIATVRAMHRECMEAGSPLRLQLTIKGMPLGEFVSRFVVAQLNKRQEKRKRYNTKKSMLHQGIS